MALGSKVNQNLFYSGMFLTEVFHISVWNNCQYDIFLALIFKKFEAGCMDCKAISLTILL